MAGLYFHIPFCRKACTYCDFHFSTTLDRIDALVQAMRTELLRRAHELRGGTVDTIYLGGGTPSLLSERDLSALLSDARTLGHVSDAAEVTMEVNPDDVTAEAIDAWKRIGITRLSIGVQSFRDDRLRAMGRAHNADQSFRSLELIAKAGFTSWTMDLIYGLPGMTIEEWTTQLDQALSFAPLHISAYCLTVEPRTALHKQVERGDVIAAPDEDQAQQFELLQQRLAAAGYVHYEISNFGKPGHFSRHNTSYWQGVPYVGIGPSAHSFDGAVRRWNMANNSRYIAGVNAGEVYWEEERPTEAQQANERIMTGLRTMWGIDLAHLPDLAPPTERTVQRYVDSGHLVRDANRIVLTKAGKLLADRIASDLFLSK
ncbi:MAG: radical SAM family heme chaperone HemW [Flavobacteriales bacterium]|nr:radical SAM family heme chaperone HemW [Flavobacteriales bacterium]